MSSPVELGPLHNFILTVLPTVTIIIFICGIFLRYRSWQRVLPQFRPPFMPTAKDLYATAKHLARKDILSTWALIWPLHISFFFVFFGHLRSIGVWNVEWFTWIAPKEFWTKVLSNAVGMVFLITILLLFVVRTMSTNMQVPATRFGDYLFIVFIIVIAITGMAMRFLPHAHGELTFQLIPGIKMVVESIPQLDVLAFHTLVSELFIMYIPFSRLMHLVTGLVT